jgi:hypothetical protein
VGSGGTVVPSLSEWSLVLWAFSRFPVDWRVIRQLRNRTPEPSHPWRFQTHQCAKPKKDSHRLTWESQENSLSNRPESRYFLSLSIFCAHKIGETPTLRPPHHTAIWRAGGSTPEKSHQKHRT